MENLCIYTKENGEKSVFKSGEHIFPAGIGGKRKLPIAYVAHEVNNSFSKLELEFMRDSIISIPRQFGGPGKRGSLSEKKATKSQISLTYSVEPDGNRRYSLGYIKLGKPFSINQFKIELSPETKFRIIYDAIEGKKFSNEQAITESLFKELEIYTRYKLIVDDNLDKNTILFGVHDRVWYLCISSDELENEAKKAIGFLLNSSKPIANNALNTPKVISNQVEVHQTLAFSMETYLRVAAKIIFNYLADSQGREFILNKRFDSIREWILHGGENKYAKVLPHDPTLNSNFFIPETAHRLFIFQSSNRCIGVISFFGNYSTVLVDLGGLDNSEGFVLQDTIGFICDWENEKEYDLLELITLKSDRI